MLHFSALNYQVKSVFAEVENYTQEMEQDVSSMEAVNERVEEATRDTSRRLESLNSTVVAIETRSQDALNASQQASQVTLSQCCAAAAHSTYVP